MMMGALQEALKLHTTREAQEQTLREELKAGLVEEAEDLVADGGPVAVTQHGETYYPLRAVLVALDYRDPATLQEAWDAVFGKQGPLPLYLCPTEDGHYAAMVAETVVLEQLIELTDEYDTAMMAAGRPVDIFAQTRGGGFWYKVYLFTPYGVLKSDTGWEHLERKHFALRVIKSQGLARVSFDALMANWQRYGVWERSRPIARGVAALVGVLWDCPGCGPCVLGREADARQGALELS
jgi:hypothetical protein